MAKVELIMPKMGESVYEATITKWLKAVGDKIDSEESILEIATDKVDSEVPSPESGVMAEILFNEGETVEVGSIIAIINTNGEAVSSPNGAIETKKELKQPEVSEPQITDDIQTPVVEPIVEPQKAEAKGSSGRFYSPLVKSIAKKEGLSLEELDQIPGTSKDGRVNKQDILNFIDNKQASTQEQVPTEEPVQDVPKKEIISATSEPVIAPATSISGNVEIIEMDRMRKLIADHMVKSKQTSPHVTSFVEVDVTNVVKWRNKVKDVFQQKEGEKITYTPIFIEAVVQAIKEFPMVNSSVDGDNILIKKNINVGMATALPSGHLIVPVIKKADYMNMVGLTKTVNDLANRARNKQLQPDEIQDGTFTITNLGSFGNVMGTPIINQPQVAILGIGAIRKKPAVIETPQGDTIGIRHMMFLSLSYDHRIVDGALGGSFLKRIAEILEGFDINRSI
ncbi:MAG: 2-oxo acid dehydrogenase subunit E2 [Bacteroidia bacterium]|nr:2-oxo acid dehydrogenase subunit E2 [Bacteroidia bacterium]